MLITIINSLSCSIIHSNHSSIRIEKCLNIQHACNMSMSRAFTWKDKSADCEKCRIINLFTLMSMTNHCDIYFLLVDVCPMVHLGGRCTLTVHPDGCKTQYGYMCKSRRCLFTKFRLCRSNKMEEK